MSALSRGEPAWHDFTFQEPSPPYIRRGHMDATVRFINPDSVSVYDYIRAYTGNGKKFARLQVKEVQTTSVRDAQILIRQQGADHHTEMEDELRDFLNRREGQRVTLTDTATVLLFERHELY